MSIFGPAFEKIWPKAGTALTPTDFGKKLLKQCENIKKPEQKEVDINEFKQKSSNFPLEFGTNTCRVMSQPEDRYPNIQQQIASAYPVIHERVLQLYLEFLEHKCLYGYPKEKAFYSNLSLRDFIQRLLTKRCAAFVGHRDSYMLITGQEGHGDSYATIGTNSEKEPLILKNCLSYDEVKLSAFLSISSHTELINDGRRQNRGDVCTDLTQIEREGVVIGIIGARFQRPLVMDYQDIVISPQQNVPEMGYGQRRNDDNNVPSSGLWGRMGYMQTRLFPKFLPTLQGNRDFASSRDYRQLWQRFYEEPDFLYNQVSKDHHRFGDVSRLGSDEIFDNVIMKKRFTITFDTLLLETQGRAAKLNKQAYLHIVGIGLGTWRIAEQQAKIFLETFSQRVKHLLPKLSNIGVLHFSWFELDEWCDLKHNGFIATETHPQGGIRTFMANRNPADKLKGTEFEDMLLVISYAWDGNALPGNEFWFKNLAGSNDSSTACSTLITELHNPHINTEWVCGENVHIASADHGITHIGDYVKAMLEQF